MNEIYWITRLDSINIFMLLAIVACIIFIIVNAIRWLCSKKIMMIVIVNHVNTFVKIKSLLA